MVVSAARAESTQITQICATWATADTLLSSEVCLADQPGSPEDHREGARRRHLARAGRRLPVRAAATMTWATDRIGPWAWVILGVIADGGGYWYCKQPPERPEKIKNVAGQIGTHVLNEYEKATPEPTSGPYTSGMHVTDRILSWHPSRPQGTAIASPPTTRPGTPIRELAPFRAFLVVAVHDAESGLRAVTGVTACRDPAGCSQSVWQGLPLVVRPVETEIRISVPWGTTVVPTTLCPTTMPAGPRQRLSRETGPRVRPAAAISLMACD